MGGERITRALILGAAASLPEDEAAALALFEPDVVIAVNHAARDRPGPVDHWASYHTEHFPRWIRERAAQGFPAAGLYWTGQHRAAVRGVELRRAPNWGGSSGLLALAVAIELDVAFGVLAGIPLDPHQGHFDSPRRKWSDGGNYRRAWLSRLDQLGRFRSMSGLTREWLGAPTKEWLDGKPGRTDAGRGSGDGERGGGNGRSADRAAGGIAAEAASLPARRPARQGR